MIGQRSDGLKLIVEYVADIGVQAISCPVAVVLPTVVAGAERLNTGRRRRPLSEVLVGVAGVLLETVAGQRRVDRGRVVHGDCEGREGVREGGNCEGRGGG